jgi:post-segregation antitoxin (ccd killing protein)
MEKGYAFDHEASNEWKSYSLQPRRLSVSVSVSRELLEDSPLSVSTIVQSRLALALAKAVDDQWCKGAEYTVSTICNGDLANPWLTYTHVATEDKDYRMQRLRDEWRRMHVGPRSVTALPEGWKCGSYSMADEWHSLARGRFDFSLDDQKTPR